MGSLQLIFIILSLTALALVNGNLDETEQSIQKRVFWSPKRRPDCYKVKTWWGIRKYFAGKYLYGTDYGCCGNYSGCCKFAHYTCYLHDIKCKCCEPKIFCGPSCRKDSSCK